MNTLILILTAIAVLSAVTWAAVRYAHLIADDGYGHRPLPPTHFDQSLLQR